MCACGVGSGVRLDETGCACYTGPATTETAARLAVTCRVLPHPACSCLLLFPLCSLPRALSSPTPLPRSRCVSSTNVNVSLLACAHLDYSAGVCSRVLCLSSPSFLSLYGKRSFSVTTPCPRPTRVNTERLAERKTLLYRLGSELNRTV